MGIRVLALLALAAWTAGCSSPASNAEGQDGMDGTVVRAVSDAHHGDHFEPADVTVPVGTSVLFRVEAGHHTVDFEDVAGVSSPHQDNLAPGTEVEVTFAEAGTFRYYCQYHLPGMTGTVTVV